jgi:hypothetical protein
MATLDAGDMKVAQPRDWKGMRDIVVRLKDSKALEVWLEKQGVTGYARSFLVMERFRYPDYLLASANDLVDAQYKDRPKLEVDL